MALSVGSSNSFTAILIAMMSVLMIIMRTLIAINAKTVVWAVRYAKAVLTIVLLAKKIREPTISSNLTPTLAELIVVERERKALKTTGDLEIFLAPVIIGDRQKYFSQVYQSLRIEVNNEFGVLRSMLEQGRRLLKPGGRFVVLTYHSLEDKIVKQFFRDNNFSGRRLEDDFGRSMIDLKALNSKPILADQAEVKRNRRAASAKLRIAEKIEL